MELGETAGAGAARDETASAILPEEEILLLIRSISDYRRLRMEPQVSVRSAKAGASARKAPTRALDGGPAALPLRLGRIIAPRPECPVQLDLPPIRDAADITGAMTVITTAVAQHCALLVRQGAVIGEGRNSATAPSCVTSYLTKPASTIRRHPGDTIGT